MRLNSALVAKMKPHRHCTLVQIVVLEYGFSSKEESSNKIKVRNLPSECCGTYLYGNVILVLMQPGRNIPVVLLGAGHLIVVFGRAVGKGFFINEMEKGLIFIAIGLGYIVVIFACLMLYVLQPTKESFTMLLHGNATGEFNLVCPSVKPLHSSVFKLTL
jgi:hypothetical protein